MELMRWETRGTIILAAPLDVQARRIFDALIILGL